MTTTISQLLEERGHLLADGATGSNLFGMGLQTGDSPELWNHDHPDRIGHLYRSFIDAGSDIILTNTFGGNRYRLKLHNAEHRVEELNQAAVAIAQDQIRQSGRKVLIGGSIGPTGEILEPLGPLSISDAAAAFEQQATALAEAGADVIWIETMSSKEEATAAVLGASKTGLPIVTTYSVDTNGRTMMGLTPADIVAFTQELKTAPFAIGANCGVGGSESIAAIMNMAHAAAEQNLNPVIVVKANCGVPEYIDGKIVYSGSIDIMARYARLAIDAGAHIIGGCCGTTPLHVAKMRQSIDQHEPQDPPTLDAIERELGEVSAGAKAQLRGEMSVAAGALSERGRNASQKRRRRRSS